MHFPRTASGTPFDCVPSESLGSLQEVLDPSFYPFSTGVLSFPFFLVARSSQSPHDTLLPRAPHNTFSINRDAAFLSPWPQLAA